MECTTLIGIAMYGCAAFIFMVVIKMKAASSSKTLVQCVSRDSIQKKRNHERPCFVWRVLITKQNCP